MKWKSFFEEREKDWNEKPGEPFGENALIIFLNILTILCLEKNDEKTNAKFNKAIWRGIRIQKIEESTIPLTC